MKTNDETGRLAEDFAARYLEQKGYRILERRFRSRQGEIDLIAKDGNTLVFVEVKYRRSLKWGRPADAVDAGKRRRLTMTVSYYLRQSRQIDACCRFDVIELWREEGSLRVHHYQNAFDGDGI